MARLVARHGQVCSSVQAASRAPAAAAPWRKAPPFQWWHYAPALILLGGRWYLCSSRSYRDLEELMMDPGLALDPTTIYRSRPMLRLTARKAGPCSAQVPQRLLAVDETSSKMRDAWMDLYRAVDSAGQIVEFLPRPFCHAPAAKCFFRQALGQAHAVMPRVMNVDKNAAQPPAAAWQAEGTLARQCELRPVKYLNNMAEQDHRFIKRRVRSGLGFWSWMTAWQTIDGDEAMTQLRKGQVRGTAKGVIRSRNEFIARSCGLAA